MTPDEKEQWERFHFEKHRHQYLVARALVRTILSRYTGIAQSDLRFSKNNNGRPELAQHRGLPRLGFNLSHTDGLIALAVASVLDIGVDVEYVERNINITFVDRFFAKKEVDDLMQTDVCDRRAHFFDYWTLKESYVKARGMGLSIPFDQFSFHISDHNPLQVSFDQNLIDDPNRWRFWLMKPDNSHRAALAVASENFENTRLTVKKTIPLLTEETFACQYVQCGLRVHDARSTGKANGPHGKGGPRSE